MTFFYITNFYEPSALHVIHALGCPDMPAMNELSYLGPFNNCSEAHRAASKKFENVKVCECCCEKHTKAIVHPSSC